MSTSEDHKKDFLFLTTLRDDDVLDDLERDMLQTINEICQQIRLFYALEAEWSHYGWSIGMSRLFLGVNYSLTWGGKQLLIVNWFLRTANVTKEKFLRLTQRFLLFDAIYMILVKYDEVASATRRNFVENMKFKKERVKIGMELAKLELEINKNINKMSQELGLTEKIVNDENSTTALFPKEKELLWQEFNNKIEGIEDNVEDIMPSSLNLNPEDERDDSYPAEIVEEVKDEGDDSNDEPAIALPPVRKHEDPPGIGDDPDHAKRRELYEPDSATRIEELERDIDHLHYELNFLKQRKTGESSTGVESYIKCNFCNQSEHTTPTPVLRWSMEKNRYDFISRKGLCQNCLDDCDPPGTCKKRNKPWWYCQVVERRYSSS
ncbi:hypothetical protein RB195_022077 [Necator americanus]|uniref:Uncharacterized protein n=1 Tax=Necator americanus TaxID=51031 RepID=A0ABR1EDU6_NECAM